MKTTLTTEQSLQVRQQWLKACDKCECDLCVQRQITAQLEVLFFVMTRENSPGLKELSDGRRDHEKRLLFLLGLKGRHCDLSEVEGYPGGTMNGLPFRFISSPTLGTCSSSARVMASPPMSRYKPCPICGVCGDENFKVEISSYLYCTKFDHEGRKRPYRALWVISCRICKDERPAQ